MRIPLVCFTVILLAGCAHAPPDSPPLPHVSENVIFVMTDGLRWQEVFRGANQSLLNQRHDGVDPAELRRRFWRPTNEQRREALMPFLWSVIARDGQIIGNQDRGSVARVTNGFNFSYPGYNEALCGLADPRIDENAKKDNPNRNVLEWLNAKPAYHDRVAAFCSWDVFPWILNVHRSGLLVNAGYMPYPGERIGPEMTLFNRLSRESPQLGESTRYDAFTFQAARHYLIERRPRVLYVSFDETDEQGHCARYDRILDDAHKVDGYIRELWDLLQTMPQYKGRTTLIFTTDHGRGAGPVNWQDHGKAIPESQYIWIAVLGPDTPALGERTDTRMITQSQIAASVAAFLGEDYRAAVPAAAPPIAEVLGRR